jgi:hypothetical protein
MILYFEWYFSVSERAIVYSWKKHPLNMETEDSTILTNSITSISPILNDDLPDMIQSIDEMERVKNGLAKKHKILLASSQNPTEKRVRFDSTPKSGAKHIRSMNLSPQINIDLNPDLVNLYNTTQPINNLDQNSTLDIISVGIERSEKEISKFDSKNNSRIAENNAIEKSTNVDEGNLAPDRSIEINSLVGNPSIYDQITLNVISEKTLSNQNAPNSLVVNQSNAIPVSKQITNSSAIPNVKIFDVNARKSKEKSKNIEKGLAIKTNDLKDKRRPTHTTLLDSKNSLGAIDNSEVPKSNRKSYSAHENRKYVLLSDKQRHNKNRNTLMDKRERIHTSTAKKAQNVESTSRSNINDVTRRETNSEDHVETTQKKVKSIVNHVNEQSSSNTPKYDLRDVESKSLNDCIVINKEDAIVLQSQPRSKDKSLTIDIDNEEPPYVPEKSCNTEEIIQKEPPSKSKRPIGQKLHLLMSETAPFLNSTCNDDRKKRKLAPTIESVMEITQYNNKVSQSHIANSDITLKEGKMFGIADIQKIKKQLSDYLPSHQNEQEKAVDTDINTISIEKRLCRILSSKNIPIPDLSKNNK